MKICKKCQRKKPLSEFHAARKARGERPPRGGFGVAAVCRPCKAEARKPGIANERKLRQRLRDRGQKTCGLCGEIKPLFEFHKRRASNDGLAYRCIACIVEVCRQHRLNNPNGFKQWYAENKESRADYWRAWYEKNKDHRAKSYAQWAKKNPHIINSLVAKRNAAKRFATPKWADQEAMRAIYAEAARLTKETGIRHEVDHIYPIQGETACGLHCEANLQILTKVENIRKSNRMPKDQDEPRRHSRNDEGGGTRSS